jgi:putative PIN family toxin of toxin-antitoxin system
VLRVVLDTVVFVRALMNPKSRSGRLLSIHADKYSIIVSKLTAQELLEVIHRPELQAKYRSLGLIDIRLVIDILANAEAVEFDSPPQAVRDPKDNIFVATAMAGHADYIVSEDKDLLVLDKPAGIPVIDTQTFIDMFEPAE